MFTNLQNNGFKNFELLKLLFVIANVCDPSLQQLAKEWEKQYISILNLKSSSSFVRILGNFQVETEVVDDEEQHVVTAGAIVTVTLVLTRK